jgi:hypothetical protein
MSGLKWKRDLDATLDRRRRFFGREMQDSILASLGCVQVDTGDEWDRFDARWGAYEDGERRPFPCNEEVFERETVGMEKRGQVEDDWLPVSYSILDAGESMVCGMFGKDMEFIHRAHRPAFSVPMPFLPDYASLSDCRFSLDNPWTQRFLSIQDYFEQHAGSHCAQHPCLTMDALNFVCEVRGATQTYIDVYEHPDELRKLMEIGLDFNIRFQNAQRDRIARFREGCFEWLGQWVPYASAVSLSVDAYVLCSPRTYADLGFEYQCRLVEHFGHGLMHFHCNRTDLAREVAKLPGLELFQYGGDPRDPRPDIDYLPEMRAILGDTPIMAACSLDLFRARLDSSALPPNVWYHVHGEPITVDQGNRLAAKVRNYRV